METEIPAALMIERKMGRGKLEEMRVARLCSRLHSCLPRFETKQPKAHALIFYLAALFDCSGGIEESGETSKSKC